MNRIVIEEKIGSQVESNTENFNFDANLFNMK